MLTSFTKRYFTIGSLIDKLIQEDEAYLEEFHYQIKEMSNFLVKFEIKKPIDLFNNFCDPNDPMVLIVEKIQDYYDLLVRNPFEQVYANLRAFIIEISHLTSQPILREKLCEVLSNNELCTRLEATAWMEINEVHFFVANKEPCSGEEQKFATVKDLVKRFYKCTRTTQITLSQLSLAGSNFASDVNRIEKALSESSEDVPTLKNCSQANLPSSDAPCPSSSSSGSDSSVGALTLTTERLDSLTSHLFHQQVSDEKIDDRHALDSSNHITGSYTPQFTNLPIKQHVLFESGDIPLPASSPEHEERVGRIEGQKLSEQSNPSPCN